jgi:hypothetical protein
MTSRIAPKAAPTGELKRPTAPLAAPPSAAPVATGTAPMARDAFVRQGAGGAAAVASPPGWNFVVSQVKRFYDASKERTKAYDFPQILKDVPAIWDRRVASDIRQAYRAAAVSVKPAETYGQLFKRIGAELGVDAHALAAYCVFESYNGAQHSFNPHMRESAGGMHAAGIAATQAQDWKGRLIPGTQQRFPKTLEGTMRMLRANPEYGVRCLAAELKQTYQAAGDDLAKAFPKTAYPAWGNPERARGNYGTQAQYVSRAHVLYQAFKQADATP